jgi:predicted DNA-binding transcriptional regulator AlpA
MAHQDSLLLSLKDVEVLTGLSRSTVYRLVTQGQLTVVKINSRHLVTRESLTRLVTPAPVAETQSFVPYATQPQGGQ